MSEVTSRREARLFRQGQDQGRLKFVLMMLEVQCGALPEKVEARVRGLSPDQVGDLGLALLRFSQLGDLTAWLDANALTEP
jgi:hypothetical protein